MNNPRKYYQERIKIKEEYEKEMATIDNQYSAQLTSLLTFSKQIISGIINNQHPQNIIAKMQDEEQLTSKFLQSSSDLVEQTNMRILISEKIVQQYRKDEVESYQEYEKIMNNVKQKLSQKEYQLQVAETQLNKIEMLLKKYSNTDEEISNKLQDLEISSIGYTSISNVVVENKRLKEELRQIKKCNKDTNEQIKQLELRNYHMGRLILNTKAQDRKKSLSSSVNKTNATASQRTRAYSEGNTLVDAIQNQNQSVLFAEKSAIPEFSLNASSILQKRTSLRLFTDTSAIKFE